MSNIRLFEPAISDSFDSMFKRFFTPSRLENPAAGLEMPIDVAEKNGIYLIHADLPGVKKEDINVRIERNMIQIDAEVRNDKEVKEPGDRVLRSERYYGAVSRSFTVAHDVDDSRAKASFQNGVLTLELPKKASTEGSKRLQIN